MEPDKPDWPKCKNFGIYNAFNTNKPFLIHEKTKALVIKRITLDKSSLLFNALKYNSTLTKLDFSGNSVGVEGAKALFEVLEGNRALLCSLSTLLLSCNKFGDAAMEWIAKIVLLDSNISTLSLNRNWLGKEGMQYLLEPLQINTCLTSLDLSYNNLNEPGALDPLCQALKTNTTLTKLDLRGKLLDPECISVLQDMLNKNFTLQVLAVETRTNQNSTLDAKLKRNKQVQCAHQLPHSYPSLSPKLQSVIEECCLILDTHSIPIELKVKLIQLICITRSLHK